MSERETCEWTGASGRSYKYFVHPRHADIKADQIGNYIYARKNEQGAWVPVYIGEGDLSVRCTQSHHQIECINSKGATHVHMHLNGTEDSRWAEESDLLARYKNALAPHGCNQSATG